MLLGFISMIYDVIIANILFMSEGVIPSKLYRVADLLKKNAEAREECSIIASSDCLI